MTDETERRAKQIESGFWDAFHLGELCGPVWHHVYMTACQDLAEDLGFDRDAANYDAEEVMRRIPIVARRKASEDQ